MPDVATLSADDVQRLVESAWCAKCGLSPREVAALGEHPHCNALAHSGLFTRCPDCQPDGLEWFKASNMFDAGFLLVGDVITVAHAIDLILMSIARSGTTKFEVMRNQPATIERLGDLEEAYEVELTTAVMSCDLSGAVAAQHRLLDLEDKT